LIEDFRRYSFNVVQNMTGGGAHLLPPLQTPASYATGHRPLSQRFFAFYKSHIVCS
jgi:hypothetical protein